MPPASTVQCSPFRTRNISMKCSARSVIFVASRQCKSRLNSTWRYETLYSYAKRTVPSKNVGNRGAVSNRAGAKKEWRDTKYVDYLSKDKGMVGKRGGVVNGKGRGDPPLDRGRSKVAGSGYGYKERAAPQKVALPKVTLPTLRFPCTKLTLIVTYELAGDDERPTHSSAAETDWRNWR